MNTPRSRCRHEDICVLAAQIHAATARLAHLVADEDSGRQWADHGARSCGHWLTINAGFSLRTSNELVRVGHALEQLPQIKAAFASGRLSFDKVRAVTAVATADDDAVWLNVALHASGSQLARICRGVRSALDVNDPRRADDELAHRGVRRFWRDDGMLEILAVLPREDGAVVMAAIDAVAKDLVAERRQPQAVEDDSAPLPLSEPVLRADALVRICESRVSAASPEPVVAPTRQMVVHVDASVLRAGERIRPLPHRGRVLVGAAVGSLACMRLGCGHHRRARWQTAGCRQSEPRDNAAASSRTAGARDQGCRYPGCGVPAKRTEGHHIRHWLDGGPTDLENLISLCRFHHRRHHEGRFEIRRDEDGDFVFERSDGTPIVVVEPVAAEDALVAPEWITADTPVAASHGEPCDFRFAVSVLADGR